jgi:hypothetical protein
LNSGHDCNPERGSELFFNDPVIRDALHVYEYFSGNWSACSEAVSSNYKKNESQSYHIYPLLMQAGYRVVRYLLHSGYILEIQMLMSQSLELNHGFNN